MKRRHRLEDESSLELLLDTMCNTFGGVMFIAIAIFVVASANTFRQVSTPDKLVQDTAAMQKTIADLQSMISELQFAADLRQTDQTDQVTASLMKPSNEIAIITQLHQELLVKNTAVQTTCKLLTQQIRQAAQQQSQQKQQLINQQKQLQQLQLTCDSLQQKITELQKRSQSSPQLTFNAIKPSPLPPFFIILHGTAAWPVGPWSTPEQPHALDRPDPAVSYSVQDALITCHIKPQQGIEVLHNNELSPQFSALLRRIPPERVPKFFIHPNSAATACRMRELLKKQKLRHGCTLARNDQEPFHYQFTPEAAYEY